MSLKPEGAASGFCRVVVLMVSYKFIGVDARRLSERCDTRLSGGTLNQIIIDGP